MNHLIASTVGELFCNVQRNLFYLYVIPINALELLLLVAGFQVVYLKCFNNEINEWAKKKRKELYSLCKLLDHWLQWYWCTEPEWCISLSSPIFSSSSSSPQHFTLFIRNSSVTSHCCRVTMPDVCTYKYEPVCNCYCLYKNMLCPLYGSY
jgi:hypothetical protein